MRLFMLMMDGEPFKTTSSFANSAHDTWKTLCVYETEEAARLGRSSFAGASRITISEVTMIEGPIVPNSKRESE